jgi:hypothetical protein
MDSYIGHNFVDYFQLLELDGAGGLSVHSGTLIRKISSARV